LSGGSYLGPNLPPWVAPFGGPGTRDRLNLAR